MIRFIDPPFSSLLITVHWIKTWTMEIRINFVASIVEIQFCFRKFTDRQTRNFSLFYLSRFILYLQITLNMMVCHVQCIFPLIFMSANRCLAINCAQYLTMFLKQWPLLQWMTMNEFWDNLSRKNSLKLLLSI